MPMMTFNNLSRLQQAIDEGCKLLTGGSRVAGKSKGYWIQVCSLRSVRS